MDAAGEEVAAKEKARRIKEHEQFKRQLAEVEQKLEAERARAEETEHSAARISEKASNNFATLDALVERGSGRFRKARIIIRAMSIIIALIPIGALLRIGLAGHLTSWAAVGGVIAILLAAASAMDRPGAWLSKLIHRSVEADILGRLREIARNDLANSVSFSWSDGRLSWSLEG